MVKREGWQSREEFTRTMYPKIAKAVRGTGLLPGVALAQAIVESTGKVNGKWRVGGSALSRNANNYFGIKCHNKWTGGKYFSKTREETAAGQSYYVVSCFRKYPSIEASVADWVKFLQQNQRYRKVFQQNTVRGQIQALKAAGYATSGNYVNTVYDVYQSQLPFIGDTDSKNYIKLALIGTLIVSGVAILLTDKRLINEKIPA